MKHFIYGNMCINKTYFYFYRFSFYECTEEVKQDMEPVLFNFCIIHKVQGFEYLSWKYYVSHIYVKKNHNSIPLWELTQRHCIQHIRQSWNAHVVYQYTWKKYLYKWKDVYCTRNVGMQVKTQYDVLSILQVKYHMLPSPPPPQKKVKNWSCCIGLYKNDFT